ncbi:hypothetical protein DEU56DRAFT_918752 [Suillus clintonianus]|uniref:uncharacterized protein n=1 Tax=Suillus clintonianus TaxID=1904413 RepID=UPI001B862DB7|nr:uncharacterized protein DEU56DRAFT_918752 [Suillus clintonianus]KAG2118592.1 hypothetical protein DEU56DRAFT_918752 [Suillus clintonianus]
MNNNLHVIVRDGQVYTSLTAHSLPDVIPHEPLWDPREDYDSSPDDSNTPLTTRWAYGARPWFPLVPLNPSFDGPIFGCLNHSRFSLLTEVDTSGRHILHRDIWAKWVDLEQKLLWCQERLGAGLLIPWGTKLPRPPTTYGSRDAFLLIAATCSWYIMTRRYQGANQWTAILTSDPQHPIPAEWVLELLRSFVGDLTTNVPRTGALISSIHCPWQVQLPMFEKFSLPIWVRVSGDTSAAVDFTLRHYIPSPAAITRATEAVQCKQTPDTWGQPDDSAWGQPDDSAWGRPEDNTQSVLNWDDSVLGWGQNSGAQPVSDVPEAHADSLFPVSQPHSRQKQGEDFKAFFARRRQENQRKEEMETPAQRQSRQSRERAAMNHSIPGKSSTVVVFEWQPNDDFGGFRQRIRLTKAEIPMTWMSYSKSTRVYDSFRNEWDLCDALDLTSIPDGDWEEDDFPPAPAPSEPTPAPPAPPPPLSSFLKDIEAYFGHYEVAPSTQYTPSTTTPRGRSTTFDDWARKTQWTHLCRLVGDNPTDITSIPDAQKDVITCFIGYLVTLPQTQLSDIPPDLWDLGPDSSLSVSNAHIRVSFVQQPNQRLYIIESLSSNLVPWKLAVPDAITAVMCLQANRYKDVAANLSSTSRSTPTYGTPHILARTRLPPLRISRLARFRPVFADYIVLAARAALLHGGLIWRLASHSLGFDVLPSVLDGISREAVPFGLMLDINGQTYFDDELSEEEIDFMCGTYYLHTNDGNVEIVSWWPRPQAWAASGLNVGFWSSRCESWFQLCLGNIRQGVSRERLKFTNDANGPMTGSQWKGSLKFNAGTSKMMKNVNAASCSFLATKASAFTEN